MQVFDSIMNGKKEKAAKIMDQIGIKLKGDDKDQEGKKLLKVGKWQ